MSQFCIKWVYQEITHPHFFMFGLQEVSTHQRKCALNWAKIKETWRQKFWWSCSLVVNSKISWQHKWKRIIDGYICFHFSLKKFYFNFWSSMKEIIFIFYYSMRIDSRYNAECWKFHNSTRFPKLYQIDWTLDFCLRWESSQSGWEFFFLAPTHLWLGDISQ